MEQDEAVTLKKVDLFKAFIMGVLTLITSVCMFLFNQNGKLVESNQKLSEKRTDDIKELYVSENKKLSDENEQLKRETSRIVDSAVRHTDSITRTIHVKK